MSYPMRLELTLASLLVKLANHYITRGAQKSEDCAFFVPSNGQIKIIHIWSKHLFPYNCKLFIIFTQPLRSDRIWHKVNFFKRSLRGLNSEFSISYNCKLFMFWTVTWSYDFMPEWCRLCIHNYMYPCR